MSISQRLICLPQIGLQFTFTIGPKHMLENLFGEYDVEFFVENACADVEIRIAHGLVARKTKVLPLHAADFQRLFKMKHAYQASCFLIHDFANPVAIAARMHPFTRELVGFLHPATRLSCELETIGYFPSRIDRPQFARVLHRAN
jgi:hypothetical protein